MPGRPTRRRGPGQHGAEDPKPFGGLSKNEARDAKPPLRRNTHGKKAETINGTKGNHGLYPIDLQPYLAELWTTDANYRRDMCIYLLSPDETALTGRLNQKGVVAL